MEAANLKKYAFTVKAIEAKRLVLDDVMKMSEKEIRALQLSNALINAILSMKKENVPMDATVLRNEFIEIQRAPEEPEIENVEIKEYVVQDEPVLPIVPTDTEEGVVPCEGCEHGCEYCGETADELTLDDKGETTVVEEEPETIPVLAESEKVEIVQHKIASPGDLKTITDALNHKELRTAAAYMKYLQTAVPDTILKSVPSDTVLDLCNKRVAEVKAPAKK